MLDLGTSFLASVARDPSALAIVDGDVRLAYAEWYRRISSVIAGLDALGLKAGDHLVTVLQNRWEAATLHWACQFAGIIITPLNWRASADDLDFVCEDADAKAFVYEDVSSEAVHTCKVTCPRVTLGDINAWISLDAPDAQPQADAHAWSVMLYTSGTTARPKGVPRRQRAPQRSRMWRRTSIDQASARSASCRSITPWECVRCSRCR